MSYEETTATRGVIWDLNGTDFSHVKGEGWRGVGRIHAESVDFYGNKIRVEVKIEVYGSRIDNNEVGSRVGKYINHLIDHYLNMHPDARRSTHPSVDLVIKKV